MTTYQFTRSVGLGNFDPEAPPEFKGAISAFGYNSTLKKMHRALKACINKIPRSGGPGEPSMRDAFLKSVSMDLSDQEVVRKFCSKLGYASAMRDLLEKRINDMTAVDFIVDKSLATPDEDSFKAVRDTVLRPDQERFARVVATPGRQTNEWDVMENDDGPST